MNQWYFTIGIWLILFMLLVGIVFGIILFIVHKVRKHNNKTIAVSMGINFALLVVVILYALSHSTYYRYNDWAILQSDIHMVKQKYGEFDLGNIKENEKGKVAYYIYTDNGPIMPDHLKHYYYIEYDEWGVVYNVYDSCQPGG